MIEVRMEMCPGGDDRDDARYGLVTIAIWNDGDATLFDPGRGDYEFLVSHQHTSLYGARAAERTGIEEPSAKDLIEHREWVWKRGRVTGFRREAGAAKLLARVMREARL